MPGKSTWMPFARARRLLHQSGAAYRFSIPEFQDVLADDYANRRSKA